MAKMHDVTVECVTGDIANQPDMDAAVLEELLD